MPIGKVSQREGIVNPININDSKRIKNHDILDRNDLLEIIYNLLNYTTKNSKFPSKTKYDRWMNKNNKPKGSEFSEEAFDALFKLFVESLKNPREKGTQFYLEVDMTKPNFPGVMIVGEEKMNEYFSKKKSRLEQELKTINERLN